MGESDIDERKKQLAYDLYLTYETGRADHFTADLFRLINKADAINKFRLGAGYPDHVAILKEYHATEHAEDFYRKYQVGSYKSEG